MGLALTCIPVGMEPLEGVACSHAPPLAVFNVREKGKPATELERRMLCSAVGALSLMADKKSSLEEITKDGGDARTIRMRSLPESAM